MIPFTGRSAALRLLTILGFAIATAATVLAAILTHAPSPTD